jgi:DNA-binding IclR family transcriptional regulator
LQTLVQCGWATQDGASSRYAAGLKLFELGALVDGAVDLKERLHPFLAALAQATGETIHLAVLDGADIVYLDKFDSPLPVAAYSRVGGRAPAYCVASGKALLAALALDDTALRVRLALDSEALPAHTPHTLATLSLLQADLAQARTRGWARNFEEWRLGVCGLGAAVFNARAEPVAAIDHDQPPPRMMRPPPPSLRPVWFKQFWRVADVEFPPSAQLYTCDFQSFGSLVMLPLHCSITNSEYKAVLLVPSVICPIVTGAAP